MPFRDVLSSLLCKTGSIALWVTTQIRYTSAKGRFSRSENALISARHLSMKVSSLSRNKPSGEPGARALNSSISGVTRDVTQI